MQLKNIHTIAATLVCETGLHIGASDSEMHIGGIDNAVVKHPITEEPYIPGSSIKGKMRAMLEWRTGFVKDKPLGYADYKAERKQSILDILKLFGPHDQLSAEQALEVGPTRIACWDAMLDPNWVKQQKDARRLLTEAKTENIINRIDGAAQHPRQTERVPAGARFLVKITMKDLGDDDDLIKTLFAGMRLIELDGLGGSVSRGYGKVRFDDLTVDGVDRSQEFRAVDPFAVR